MRFLAQNSKIQSFDQVRTEVLGLTAWSSKLSEISRPSFRFLPISPNNLCCPSRALDPWRIRGEKWSQEHTFSIVKCRHIFALKLKFSVFKIKQRILGGCLFLYTRAKKWRFTTPNYLQLLWLFCAIGWSKKREKTQFLSTFAQFFRPWAQI